MEERIANPDPRPALRPGSLPVSMPGLMPGVMPEVMTEPMTIGPSLMSPDSAPDCDEQLMLAYAAGDVSAFDRLYAQYRAPLYRFVLRQVKDPVASNDIYQQCWEKVIKGRHLYRSKSPFPAWLFRIARNTVVDHFRRAGPVQGSDPAELTSTAPGPEEQALHSESEQKLANAIARLPAEQREVVLLRLEAGLDLTAIADITGVNTETCKSRLRYALAKLKEQMQESGDSVGGPHVPA